MTAFSFAHGQGDGQEGLHAPGVPPAVRSLDQDDFPREWNDEDYDKVKAFVKYWDGVNKRGASSRLTRFWCPPS